MKAKRALALVPVLALALAGCGGSSGGGNAGGWSNPGDDAPPF